MHYSLVTPPAQEPIRVSDARRHLRLFDSDGEPAPLAPSVALAGSGSGNLSNGVYRYKVTFVTSDGETEGGAASGAVTVSDNATDGRVALSDIPVGGDAVTARKIYRTEVGGADYLLLATIADNVTTAYADNIADASLGASVPVVNTTEDPYVSALIATARQLAERMLGRALITQTYDLTLDRFPCESAIELRRPPVQSVTSVTYIDASGVSQTLSTDVYEVSLNREMPQIRLKSGKSWPSTYDAAEAVTIRFAAGYGDAPGDVPYPIRQATLLMIGHLYNNREDVTVGVSAADLPKGATHLLCPYKIWRA